MVHAGGPFFGDAANPSISMQGVSMAVLSMHDPHWWTVLSELQLPHKDARVSTAIILRYELRCWVADADKPGVLGLLSIRGVGAGEMNNKNCCD